MAKKTTGKFRFRIIGCNVCRLAIALVLTVALSSHGTQSGAWLASRLASHTFISIGQTLNLSGLGALLEVVQLEDPPAVRIVDDSLEAVGGGTACLRFHYREVANENGIQTLCIVVFEETGSCAGLAPLELDLNRFLSAPPALAGNANLLEHGDGQFYQTCRTADGATRLQRNERPLPPLFLNTVDALTQGPYALGRSEVNAQRNGAITTFSGDTLTPSWVITASREIYRLNLTPDAGIEINSEDCNVVPSCSDDPNLVWPGDVFRVSLGLGVDLFEQALMDAPLALRDRFFQTHLGLPWPALERVHPDAKFRAFARLVNLLAMD